MSAVFTHDIPIYKENQKIGDATVEIKIKGARFTVSLLPNHLLTNTCRSDVINAMCLRLMPVIGDADSWIELVSQQVLDGRN